MSPYIPTFTLSTTCSFLSLKARNSRTVREITTAVENKEFVMKILVGGDIYSGAENKYLVKKGDTRSDVENKYLVSYELCCYP